MINFHCERHLDIGQSAVIFILCFQSDRLRRMRGITEEEALTEQSQMRSADDLDDGYVCNVRGAVGRSYHHHKNGTNCLPAAWQADVKIGFWQFSLTV